MSKKQLMQWTRTALLVGAVALAGCAPKGKQNMVTIVTNMGEITLELYPEQAPETVANFLRYVDEEYYDGTIFHRVIDGFMIQGGGFTPEMKQKEAHAPVKNEAHNGLLNERGTVAMARTSDIHSATAQFFINVADNVFLNHRSPDAQGYGYCVFARVTEGMDVVDRIKGVSTRTVGHFADVPVEPVVIESVRRGN